ncbi:hypothetical protein CLOP_g10519 [Closterium sp. NIES-67]|nr:hypothetical protein CLOP_g10519 [Closterium sp. NIES-67]
MSVVKETRPLPEPAPNSDLTTAHFPLSRSSDSLPSLSSPPLSRLRPRCARLNLLPSPWALPHPPPRPIPCRERRKSVHSSGMWGMAPPPSVSFALELTPPWSPNASSVTATRSLSGPPCLAAVALVFAMCNAMQPNQALPSVRIPRAKALVARLGLSRIPRAKALVARLGLSRIPRAKALVARLGLSRIPRAKALVARLGLSRIPRAKALVARLGLSRIPPAKAKASVARLGL